MVVENFRPGVMEGWGLGPKDLPPGLVFTRISGYGQVGARVAEGVAVNHISVSDHLDFDCGRPHIP